jgi:hypothetical protein
MTRLMQRSHWQGRRTFLHARHGAPRRAARPGLEALDARVVPAGGVSAAYAVTQDWGSGFQAQLTLTNTQATPVAGWSLAFDLPATVSSVWDARVVSHAGNHYVVSGLAYDATLPAGGSVAFGFVASPGQAAAPANLTLNGVPLGGGSSASLPALSVADASVLEGNSGTTPLTFTVSLSAPSPTPVTAGYATADGTAAAGSDYVAASGTLTFAPGQVQKTVTVSVLGDTVIEPDETLRLTLSGPAGATLGRGQAVGTIANDDVGPIAPVAATFQVTSDWGSGFNGQISLHNNGASAVGGWSVAFDFPGTVTSFWDGTQAGHSGDHYVVKSAGWNDTIPAGGTASFGFTATPGGGAAVPANLVVTTGPATGTGTGTGGGPTDHPPNAVDDAATATEGLPVAVDVLANDTDPDGDPLTAASFTQGRNGAVTADPASPGVLTYTPKAGFTGSDSFTYAVSDGRGDTATAAVAVTVVAPARAGSWPSRVYAPYVDMTLYPTYDLASAVRASGTKFFTLAFVVAGPQNQPSWGGYGAYAVNGGAFDTQVRSEVNAVRALGGDVMVSFGGENGQELAQAVTDVNALESAYQSVVAAYGLTHLDFDIEGAAVADRASVDRRSQALAALQATDAAAGQPLQVWFTLPALPTGLTADGLYVLQSALKYGVHVAGVNVMAMDYGDSAAPSPKGQMGTYAIDAATSLFGQLKGLYGTTRTDAQLWSMVGVTPMIGLNDVTTEVFDTSAASQLAAFAAQHGLGRLSVWSLNRDQSDPAGAITYVEPTSSSLDQKPYDFSKAFLAYQG